MMVKLLFYLVKSVDLHRYCRLELLPPWLWRLSWYALKIVCAVGKVGLLPIERSCAWFSDLLLPAQSNDFLSN